MEAVSQHIWIKAHTRTHIQMLLLDLSTASALDKHLMVPTCDDAAAGLQASVSHLRAVTNITLIS